MTNCDPLNAVVAQIARTIYNVPHVVVRNYDPRWRELHEMFGSQVISSTSWGAQRIEELIENENVRTVYSAWNGEVKSMSFEVTEKLDHHKLSELMACEECLPVSLTRAGKAILPNKDTLLVKDDLIQFSATISGVRVIRGLLAKA